MLLRSRSKFGLVATASTAVLLLVGLLPPAWADAPLSPGAVTTLAGDGQPRTVDGTGSAASFNSSGGTVLLNGKLYVATADAIRRVDLSTGAVSTVAGLGAGPCGTDSPTALNVTFGNASALVTDGSSLITVLTCAAGAWAVRSTSVPSGATTTLGTFFASGAASLSATAVVGTSLYIAVGPSIVKFNLSTGASSVVATETAGSVFAALTVDSAQLWAVAANGSSGQSHLDSINLTSLVMASVGTPATFSDGGPGGTSIANAGSFLFVGFGGSIRRYAKADAAWVDVAGVGGFDSGWSDGTGTDAWLTAASSMTFDGTVLWVSDASRLRRVGLGTALPSSQAPVANVTVPMSLAQLLTITGSSHTNSNGPLQFTQFSDGAGMIMVGHVLFIATTDAVRAWDRDTGYSSTVVPAETSSNNSCGADGTSSATSTARDSTSLTSDGYYLYLGDKCGRVRRISITTGATSTVESTGSTTQAGSLTFGADGYLYMAGMAITNAASYDTNVYRINPRTGVMTVFVAEAGATRLRAMTSDATSLWVTVQVPCHVNPCGSGLKLDRIDLGTRAITTIDDEQWNNAGLAPPYGTALVSAGAYLYGERGSTITQIEKSTGIAVDVAGTASVYTPSPRDGYGSQAQASYVTAMTTDGSSIFFMDQPGSLRVAIPAPSPLPGGSTDAESGSPDACDCLDNVVDPVNTATGGLTESMSDMSLPGRYAVPWGRAYSSVNAAQDSPLGYGWSGDFVEKLTRGATSADPVKIKTETGPLTQFNPTSSAVVFGSAPRVHATLIQDSVAGTWTYTRRKNISAVFASDGRLVTKTDHNGEKITLAYNAATPPQLMSVTTADGRALTITYNAAGRIWKVTGPGATGVPARVVTYGYDTAGNLTSVIDTRGKTWVYGYDGNHHLTSITSPNGGVTTTSYDGSGKVSWQRDARLKTTNFGYTDTTAGADRHRVTRVTDPTGVITDYEYVNGWIRSKTIAPGTAAASTWSYTYDLAGNQTSVTDPTGELTSSTFDGEGNRLTQTVLAGGTFPDGTAAGTTTTTWKYNSRGEPLQQSDTSGALVTWSYDTTGNVLNQARKLDTTDTATTSWTRTDTAHPGDVTSTTDPLGNVTSYSHTAEGFISALTSPAGNVTDTTDSTVKNTMTYTPYGEVLTSVEPRGNVTGGTPTNYTTTKTYDGGGLILTSKSPLGLVTTYTYDGDGHRTTVTNNSGQIWRTAFLPDGLVDTVTDPLTHVTTRDGYDDAGRLTSYTDATGNTIGTSYDDHGRPATSVRPSGNVAGATAAVKAANSTTFGYDLAGRLTTTTAPDPTGGAALVSMTVYDTAGRVWKSTTAAGQTTTTKYDGRNNVSSITDPAGNQTQFNRDLAARTVMTYDPRGNAIGTTYDKAGHVVTITDSLLTATSPTGRNTTQTWDTAGRLRTVTDARGNATGAVAANFTTTYTYDASGNRRITTDNLAHQTKVTYDRDGRVATQINAKNRTTNIGYDTTGRLWKITAPDGGVTVFGYDIADRRTSITAPMLGVWTSGYDNAGRLTSQTDPATITRSYGYTPDGQLQTVTTPRGTTTRAYNTLGQFTSLSYTDATPSVSYSYDRAGRRIGITDGSGTLAYAYDAASRPTVVTRTPITGPASTWGFSYDANGNLLTRTRPDSTTETYTYDIGNQATQVIDPNGTTTWTYDDAGNPLAAAMPNGTTETRTWDRAGALASIATKKAAAVLTSQTVTRDASNQPTKIVVLRSGTTENRSYLYDNNERLTDVCYAATCTAPTATQHWTYDKDGNRLTEQNGVAPGVVTTSSYNTSDRLTSTRVGTGTSFTPTYDSEGNLTSDNSGRTYTYGLNGLTTSVAISGSTTNYTYDGTGNRLTATTTGTGAASSYTWNPLEHTATLAQIITDPDGAGPSPATTTINRYDPSGNPLSVTAGGATAFVAHDPLGSVTDLTNSSGAISRSYDYTPYGTPRTPISAPASPSGPNSVLGYTGAVTDATGLLNLHARQYDPTSGQFTQPDPAGYTGSAGYTGGYGTPYGYTAGRVTTLTDPSGLEPCSSGSPNCNPALSDVAGGNLPMGENSGGGDNRASQGERQLIGQFSTPEQYAGAQIELQGLVTLGPQGDHVPAGTQGEQAYQQAFNKFCSIFAQKCAARAALQKQCRNERSLQLGLAALALVPGVGEGALALSAEEVAATGVAAGGAAAVEPTLVIGRGADLAKSGALGPREFKLSWPTKLPDFAAEWKVNSGLLRTAMRAGKPIRDASPGDTGGVFLNAERNLLEDRGWTFSARSGYWTGP